MPKSLSKTPAPKKDRIYGSKKNPKGSASSEKSAKGIKLSADIIASLSKKLKEFKENHKTDKVTLNDLKAVYRRGLGAYSSTHRPTISGGKPNTRNAWAMARVNAFLRKAGGGEAKKSYVQDDDLLKYKDGGKLKLKDFTIDGTFYNKESYESSIVIYWYADDSFYPKKQPFIVGYTTKFDDNGERVADSYLVDNGHPKKFETIRISTKYHPKKTITKRLMTLMLKELINQIESNKYAKGGEVDDATFLIIIKNIKNPDESFNSVKNKYRGAYAKIFDILNDESIFMEWETTDEFLKGNDFFLYFNNTPDINKIERISKIPNVEIITKYDNGGEINEYVFLRFGLPNRNDKGEYVNSYSYVFGHKGTEEGGISVFEALKVNNEYKVFLSNSKMRTSFDELISSGRDLYLVEGEDSGNEGFDGEILLDAKTFKVIKKIDQKNVSEYNPNIKYKDGGEVDKEKFINEYLKKYDIDREKTPSRILKGHIKTASKIYAKKILENLPYKKYIIQYKSKEGASYTKEILARTPNEARKEFMMYSFGDEITSIKLSPNQNNYAKGGSVDDHKETYKKWKSLVNMSYSELDKFYNSKEGKEAGLSSSEAKAQGIDSGRESARWILKMKKTPHSKWTPTMWKWAKKQISFISRMSGNKGGLYDDKGNKTRKHTSLLIWGHNPKKESSMKYENGGSVDDLWQKIRKASKNTSDVVYIGSKDKVSIKEYKDLTPYSAQAYQNGKYKVSFMKDDTMVTFTNEVSEKKEDRNSYEKYKGLIYIFEPITDDVSKEISQKIYGNYKKGGLTGDVHSLTDKLLSQKIQMFLKKVEPYKFYYVDESRNTLYVGFDEHFSQDSADKVYKEATSSSEFFDADGVESVVSDLTSDTIFTIPLKRKVEYEDGGELSSYNKRVQDNLTHMGTKNDEWSSLSIIGESVIEINGKEKKMPLFDFESIKGYKEAPTLFPSSKEPMNCELCGKIGIKTIYYIKNDSKKTFLKVGSECVTHFGEGKSGKQNQRQFRIEKAKLLDFDLIKFKKLIYSNLSYERSVGYGKKQREWKSFYIGKEFNQEYLKEKIEKLGDISLLIDKNNPNQINWYNVYKNIPSFGYEAQVLNEQRFSKTPNLESVDKNLLTWFTKNEEFAKQYLEQIQNVLKVFRNELKSEDIDLDSNYLDSFDLSIENNQYEDGGMMDVRMEDTVQRMDDPNFADPSFYKSGGRIVGLTDEQIDTNSHIIAKKFKLPIDYINSQLKEGVKAEMEHTSDKSIASKIALDHLAESPFYYQKLKEMEKELETMKPDEYLPRIQKAYANGGTIDMVFKMSTPTKEPTKLNYIQQVLVRTTEFKNWFGDWERCAENFLNDNKKNFQEHYKNCSIVIDTTTLEPQVVYHGTPHDEFFTFDVTREKGVGRPYGYFADNIEYSQNFSSRGRGGKEVLYKCFLNIRNPFIAIDDYFYDEHRNGLEWSVGIAVRMAQQKNPLDPPVEEYLEIVKSQIRPYLERLIPYNDKKPFWYAMSFDKDKDFKYFLMSHGYDGVRYAEEFSSIYDVNNPAEFTKAWTIFDADQVKLADGRNIDFDPFNKDIRFEEGGTTEMEDSMPQYADGTKIEENNEHMENKMSKSQQMRATLGLDGEKFAEGGHVKGDGKSTDDAKKGGYFEGRSHAEGGIKAVNKDTGQLLEVEGNEVIINKRSVADNTKREFEGKMMTNREILSKINEMGGGVSFAEGGEINEKNCKCIGKKYKFGGEMVDDFDIVKQLTNVTDYVTQDFSSAVNYVDDLFRRINK